MPFWIVKNLEHSILLTLLDIFKLMELYFNLFEINLYWKLTIRPSSTGSSLLTSLKFTHAATTTIKHWQSCWPNRNTCFGSDLCVLFVFKCVIIFYVELMVLECFSLRKKLKLAPVPAQKRLHSRFDCSILVLLVRKKFSVINFFLALLDCHAFEWRQRWQSELLL